MKYKRYWLFSYDAYYPSGGMGDFVDSFDTIEEAINNHKRSNDPSGEYAEILDIDSMETIKFFKAKEWDDIGEWRDLTIVHKPNPTT